MLACLEKSDYGFPCIPVTCSLQHNICPRLDPGIALFGDHIGSKGGSLCRRLCIFGERIRQYSIRVYRVNEHLQGHVFLKLFAEHKIDEFLSKGTLLSPFEDAHKFNLTEAGILSENRRGRGIIKLL